MGNEPRRVSITVCARTSSSIGAIRGRGGSSCGAHPLHGIFHRRAIVQQNGACIARLLRGRRREGHAEEAGRHARLWRPAAVQHRHGKQRVEGSAVDMGRRKAPKPGNADAERQFDLFQRQANKHGANERTRTEPMAAEDGEMTSARITQQSLSPL
ncbi:hypothetical protein DFJ73DRAFT_151873 [Zopfochytrium polystomum]|nr:hypothetical protein DFJ73DRAFT_151873 [Zopfochytrium polystomum]